MNNILEMIKNEKVEWKKLGEIAVVSGAGVDKKIKENEKVIKLLNYMDVYKNLYINSDIPQMKVTASDKKIKDCDIKYGDIFITPSSETKEDIFMSSVAIENFEKTVYSYHIMRIRLKEKNFITSCFLNYIFRSIEFRKKMQKKVFGNTRQTITKTEIEKLEVPIPSLKTQEKIVEILDSFVKYSTELQAELQNRTKQYEYYRDLLLSEEYLNKLSESPEIIGGGYAKLRIYNIEDITKIKNGKDWKKLNSGDIPVYGSGGYMNVSVDKYVYNKPTVLIPRKGSIENIFYLDKPFWNVDTIFYTEIDETKIIPKYFYYFMKTLDLKSLSTNSTRPSLTQTVLNKVKIKLPSLEIQNKVVEVLDRFQDLISNAEGLLPVEIEQRQKQYEYYREKLLTFENNMVQVKSSQVKSSQVVLSSCYFEILREACELVGSKYFDIKTKRLEDVCEILDYKRKPISKNKRIKGIYPYYGANGVQDYVNDYIFDGTYILMGEDGSVIDKNNNPILHWVDDKKIWVNNHAHVLKNLNNEINLKYVFYYLSTCDVSSIVKGTPPKINQGNLRKIRILIPPINVQEYVVSILDKFDMLVNNINDGLPKEIELRQKQYEYYREKLLDFPRKEIS